MSIYSLVILFFIQYCLFIISTQVKAKSCDINTATADENGFVRIKDCELETFDVLIPNTESLIITGTQLNEIPKVLEKYPELVQLSMSENAITSCTDSLKLPELILLALNDNPLKLFDMSAASLPKIETLHLYNTSLKVFPESLGEFTTLRTLSISNYDFGHKSIMMNAKFPPSLENLAINGNGLTEIPSDIYNLKKLDALFLTENKLDPIVLSQKQFQFLSNLTELYMTAPSSLESCGTPQSIQALNYTGESGEPKQVLNVCVTDSPNINSTEVPSTISTPVPTNTTNTPSIYSNTWLYIVVILLSILIGGIVFAYYVLGRNHVHEKDTTTTGTEAIDNLLSNNLQAYRLNVNDIDDIKIIGTGGFAIVWLVKYQHEQYLASKRLRTGDMSILSSDKMDAFTKEIQMVSLLKHANIVLFVGVAWDRRNHQVNLQMLFEYMEGGDLRDCLQRNSRHMNEGPVLPYEWTRAKLQIIRDIASALVYVHSFNPPILHRDLKSRNILLSANAQTAKISDFGVSRIRAQNVTSMTANIGTVRWLAPEVASGSKNYKESADVYAFGMVLCELDSHDVPFAKVTNQENGPLHEQAVLVRLAMGLLNPIEAIDSIENSSRPERIYVLVKSCLAIDPMERPSAIEIAQEVNAILHEYKQLA